jgi:hypothetical protein
MTAEEKTQRGKQAAHARWANADMAAERAAARDRQLERFRSEARSSGENLDEAEVERRAGHLLKAHMADLTRRSIKARRERAARRQTLDPDVDDVRLEEAS